MKKIMILAAAAALVLSAACTKSEITSVNEEDTLAIGFSSYSPRSLTKAGDTYVSGTTLVSGKTFAVYSWKTANGSFLTATSIWRSKAKPCSKRSSRRSQAFQQIRSKTFSFHSLFWYYTTSQSSFQRKDN